MDLLVRVEYKSFILGAKMPVKRQTSGVSKLKYETLRMVDPGLLPFATANDRIPLEAFDGNVAIVSLSGYDGAVPVLYIRDLKTKLGDLDVVHPGSGIY